MDIVLDDIYTLELLKLLFDREGYGLPIGELPGLVHRPPHYYHTRRLLGALTIFNNLYIDFNALSFFGSGTYLKWTKDIHGEILNQYFPKLKDYSKNDGFIKKILPPWDLDYSKTYADFALGVPESREDYSKFYLFANPLEINLLQNISYLVYRRIRAHPLYHDVSRFIKSQKDFEKWLYLEWFQQTYPYARYFNTDLIIHWDKENKNWITHDEVNELMAPGLNLLGSLITYAHVAEKPMLTKAYPLPRKFQARQKLFKSSDSHFQALGVYLDEVKYFPMPNSLHEALELRNDKRLNQWREVLLGWADTFAKGNPDSERKMRSEIQKASKELRFLKNFQKISRLLVYISIPVFVLDAWLIHGVLGGICAGLGTATELIATNRKHKYGWLMIGL